MLDIKFSVIIPVYNKEKYVLRAITSILEQTYTNFELIVICDPSTDSSIKIVEDIEDDRLKIYYRDKPGPGGYEARNLGISKSKNEWIGFLDADDFWYKDHLFNMYNLIKSNLNEKLFTCSRLIDSKGKIKLDLFSLKFNKKYKNYKRFTILEYMKYSFKYDKPFHTNTIIFSKSLLNNSELLFPEGRTKRSGDIYAWVHLIVKSKTFIWSNHIGSILFKDIIGVSKTSTPSIMLFLDMVKELKIHLNDTEFVYLKQYANRLIKTVWLENKKINLNIKPLSNYLFWKGNFLYCFFWSTITLLPNNLISLFRKVYNLRRVF